MSIVTKQLLVVEHFLRISKELSTLLKSIPHDIKLLLSTFICLLPEFTHIVYKKNKVSANQGKPTMFGGELPTGVIKNGTLLTCRELSTYKSKRFVAIHLYFANSLKMTPKSGIYYFIQFLKKNIL